MLWGRTPMMRAMPLPRTLKSAAESSPSFTEFLTNFADYEKPFLRSMRHSPSLAASAPSFHTMLGLNDQRSW